MTRKNKRTETPTTAYGGAAPFKRGQPRSTPIPMESDYRREEMERRKASVDNFFGVTPGREKSETRSPVM